MYANICIHNKILPKKFLLSHNLKPYNKNDPTTTKHSRFNIILIALPKRVRYLKDLLQEFCLALKIFRKFKKQKKKILKFSKLCEKRKKLPNIAETCD